MLYLFAKNVKSIIDSCDAKCENVFWGERGYGLENRTTRVLGHLNCLHSFPVWCLGQDMEFDRVDSFSLHFNLLTGYGIRLYRLLILAFSTTGRMWNSIVSIPGHCLFIYWQDVEFDCIGS